MMKKLLLALSLFGVISLQGADPAYLNFEKNEPCNMTHSAPASPVNRRSTDNSQGLMSVSPQRIEGVRKVNAYYVQFDDRDPIVVPYKYPFNALKVMTSGPGERRHRFDLVSLRGNGDQALKDLMLLYDDPNAFTDNLYQQRIYLQNVVYLADLLEADQFANKLYIALLNHPKNNTVPIKTESLLHQALKEFGFDQDPVLLKVQLSRSDVAQIQKRPTAYQLERARARAFFGQFG